MACVNAWTLAVGSLPDSIDAIAVQCDTNQRRVFGCVVVTVLAHQVCVVMVGRSMASACVHEQFCLDSVGALVEQLSLTCGHIQSGRTVSSI